jgi:DNA-binding CsgD family transcriptional regulator
MSLQNDLNGFLDSLLKGKELFPQQLLKSLSKYFGYSHSIFMPCLGESIYKDVNARWSLSNNYIGLNFSAKDLQRYSHLSKYDFFAPSKLPEKFRNASFITVENLMTYEKYEETPYYQFIRQSGFYYQASLMLKGITGRTLACIGLFRAKEEGPFTDIDKSTLEQLSSYISPLYIAAIKQTKSVSMFDMLDSFFFDSHIGTLLTDSRGMILWSNESARNIGRKFVRRASDTLLGNISSFSEDTLDIQQVLMDLRELLFTGKEHFYSPLSDENYTFCCKPASCTNIMGISENRYLVFIVKNRKNETQTNLASLLTRREQQILNGILDGLNNDEISHQYHISSNTVRTHISNIYRKLEVKNKTEIFIKFKKI